LIGRRSWGAAFGSRRPLELLAQLGLLGPPELVLVVVLVVVGPGGVVLLQHGGLDGHERRLEGWRRCGLGGHDRGSRGESR